MLKRELTNNHTNQPPKYKLKHGISPMMTSESSNTPRIVDMKHYTGYFTIWSNLYMLGLDFAFILLYLSVPVCAMIFHIQVEAWLPDCIPVPVIITTGCFGVIFLHFLVRYLIDASLYRIKI